MPKPPIAEEKLAYIKSLLRKGYGYDIIQHQIRQKFGYGVSNSFLAKLMNEIKDENDFTLKSAYWQLEFKVNTYERLLSTIAACATEQDKINVVVLELQQVKKELNELKKH